MENDRELAELLGGQVPPTPDPGFRLDVMARTAARVRRREAYARALNKVAVFAAIGLVFPLADAAGLTWQAAQPLVLSAGAMSAAAALALLTIQGPRLVLSRSRALLRGAF